MSLRYVGCVLYATWFGGIVGLVLGIPGMVLFSSVRGLAAASPLVTGGVTGFLCGILAVTDAVGPFGRGSGHWLGAQTGLVVTAGLVAYTVANAPDVGPTTAEEWVTLAGGFVYSAGVGFVAGRASERAGRWGGGTQDVTPTA